MLQLTIRGLALSMKENMQSECLSKQKMISIYNNSNNNAKSWYKDLWQKSMHISVYR